MEAFYVALPYRAVGGQLGGGWASPDPLGPASTFATSNPTCKETN